MTNTAAFPFIGVVTPTYNRTVLQDALSDDWRTKVSKTGLLSLCMMDRASTLIFAEIPIKADQD